MAWAIDESNRSMRVEVDLPNKEMLLRPGMYATATIILEERPNVLAIPTAAIVKDTEKTYCQTVKKGVVTRKQVTLGLRVDNDIQVVSGLEENEKVIIIRPEAFKDGQQVEELP
jgi:RND family efflux transporter MFP subunit